jgi:hypothetical protein
MSTAKTPEGPPASVLIDQHITDLNDWRGQALGRMRQLIHEAAPEVLEEWKWNGTPVWSLGGILCTGESWSLLTASQGIALERNRDEWMLRMRRMGSCPCKQPGRPIARFRSNPSGSGLCGRSAALRRLPIAKLLAAHRALHPIPQRPLRDPCEAVNRLRTAAVKLTFLKGASLPDRAKLFNASLDGNARRAIDIHEGDTVDSEAFKALIRAAVALNAGGAKAKAKSARGARTAS